ncbi:MAG: PAS domain S-box protein [Bacteroidota bacterium]
MKINIPNFKLSKDSLTPGTFRLGIVFGLFMYCAFGLLDIYAMPSNYETAWVIRYGIILPLLIISFFLSYYKPIYRYSNTIMFVLITIGQLGIIAMLGISIPGDLAYNMYYVGLILVMLWASFVFRLNLYTTIYFAFSTIILYNFTAIYYQNLLSLPESSNEIAILVNNNFFLISASILVIVGAFQLERKDNINSKINNELINEKIQLKIAKEEAEESQKAYEEVVETTNDLITVVGKEGKIIFVNHASSIFFGLPPNECLGKKAFNFVHPKDIEYTIIKFEEWLTSTKNNFYIENRQVNVKGHVLDVAWNVNIVRSNNKVIKITSVGRDITEQKKADQLLRESEAHFKNMFERHNAIMLLIEPDTGIIIDSNKAASNYYGHSKTKLCSMNINEINTLTPEEVLSEQQNAKNENRNHFIFSHKLANGEVRIVEVHSSPIDIKGKQILFSIIYDITDRKFAEIALKESNEYLENLFNYANAPIVVWNNELEITRFNHAFEKLSGYTASEVFSQKIDILFPKHKIIESLQLIKETTAGEKWQTVEIEILRKNSEIRTVLWNSANILDKSDENIIATIAQGQDITDRNKATLALKYSEEKLSLLLNSTAEGIYGIDLDGSCTFANKACIEILGYKNESQLFGKNMHNLIHHTYPDGTHMDSNLCIIYKAYKQGIGTHVDNEHFWKADGSSFPVEYSSYPQYKDNEIVGAVVTFTDITQRKHNEHALIESENQLRDLNSTKDKLFSVIAHDLRSPFNSILGFSELLIDSVKGPEIAKTEKYVEIIHSSAKNTLTLLDNLLDWAKSQTGLMTFIPEELNLSLVIKEVIKFSNSPAEIKNISLNYVQTDDVMVYADHNMINTILLNLISNAIKFTNPGGNIEINSRLHQKQVEISISDNGVGMDKDTYNKIFSIDINHTTKGTAKEKGSGLGLVLCKEFVDRHQGEIWAESKKGGGSVFYFTLPLQPNLATLNSTKKADIYSDKEPPINNLKILIADDDEASQMLISIIVSKFAKDVIVVKTGAEAVKACLKNNDIDLILMDIKMPEMDGYEATRQIRKFNKNVIIIAQTAFTQNNNKEKAIAAGCNDYISKPISMEKINNIIYNYFTNYTK